MGVVLNDARLITSDELANLGCSLTKIYSACSNAPSWVSYSSFFSGTAFNDTNLFAVYSGGDLFSDSNGAYHKGVLGIRPVVVISKDYL